jgi:hypothetical protein
MYHRHWATSGAVFLGFVASKDIGQRKVKGEQEGKEGKTKNMKHYRKNGSPGKPQMRRILF